MPGIEHRGLHLVAPRYLADGDNFYSQPPFAQVIYAAAEQKHFTERQLRIGLSTVVGEIHETISLDRKPYGLNRSSVRERIGRASETEQLFDKTEIEEGTFGKLKVVFADELLQIGTNLERFPYWSSYVHAKRRPGGYNKEGERVRKRHDLGDLEPTYPYWLKQILQSQGTRRQWGIQELIPTADPGEAAAQTGQRLEHRRWIIRKIMR
jgi:hypothetical protein